MKAIDHNPLATDFDQVYKNLAFCCYHQPELADRFKPEIHEEVFQVFFTKMGLESANIVQKIMQVVGPEKILNFDELAHLENLLECLKCLHSVKELKITENSEEIISQYESLIEFLHRKEWSREMTPP